MSVSDEEFQRFQNQLLDLKTLNYQLEEQNKKIHAENQLLKSQIEKNEKDGFGLRSATKTLLKLRPSISRDHEDLQRENESLTRKLHAQEEEFKLQNATMMRELNECTKKIEALENELKLYQEGRHGNSNNTSNGTETLHQLNEENRRLKAENNVLQKRLTDLSSKTVESISTASSSNESFQKDDVEIECDDNRSDAGLVHVVSSKTNLGETKSFDSNALRLETEIEEKRLLQEQFQRLEQSSNETIAKLNKQIENLKEKLDEKQNTCLSLQRDFEKRIQEMIAESSTMKSNFESQIETFKSDLQRVQEDFQSTTKNKDDEISRYQKRLTDLQMSVDQLESQIGTVAAEQNQQLRTTNAEHQRILEDKEILLNQTILDRDLLRAESERSKEAYETLLQTVQTLEEQLTTKTRDGDNWQKLAEQRMTTIDEMAAKHLQEDEKVRTTLQKLKEKHQTDIERYEKELTELKIKDRTFKQLQSRCTELEARLQSEEEVKRVLSNRLEELQNEIVQSNENHEKQHETIKREYEEHVQNLTEILNTKALTIDELNAQIDALRQEVTVLGDERRAHERKGAAMIKDLQKQINTERKRNERMQEKLTELLSGDKAALDELFYIPKTDGSRQGDTTSVSSFGGGTGYIDRASVTSNQMSSSALEQENKELIQKLTRMQEERAILEEKVRHLESSNSTMASDLIQYYSNNQRGSATSTTMSNRYATPPSRRRQTSSIERQSQPTPSNFRSMFESFSRNKSQSNHEDEIRSLRRLLEETLTKNMHLQKDLEAMSLQIKNQTSDHS